MVKLLSSYQTERFGTIRILGEPHDVTTAALTTAATSRHGALHDLLVGCAVGPDFVKPDDRLAAVQLSPRADYTQAQETSAANFPSSWWTLFNDGVLADLQARAQAGNLNLQMASERIEQSRAQLGIASSLLLPSVGASAGYSREAISEHGKFAALGAPTSASDFWQLGFDASWELDLWGRARRSREGAAAAFEATVYEREAARVALSAEVARTYLQLRGTQAQLDITRQNLRSPIAPPPCREP